MTEYVDHERRARSNEYCMDSAWFGQGTQIKQRALDAGLQLAAYLSAKLTAQNRKMQLPFPYVPIFTYKI